MITQDYLRPPSAVSEMAQNGFAPMRGLTHWISLLSPAIACEPWSLLEDRYVLNLIHAHGDQRRRWFLTDDATVGQESELAIDFRVKKEKRYLALTDGALSLVKGPFLPAVLKEYFRLCQEFIRVVRDILNDSLPTLSLPSVLQMRIFDYRSSELLAGLLPAKICPDAMRPHVDGSVVTLIIAESDGALKLRQRSGEFMAARREDSKPFALIIPGIAAAHDLQVPPTEHFVSPGPDRRISITVFVTPDLGFGNRLQAERRLSAWKLASQI